MANVTVDNVEHVVSPEAAAMIQAAQARVQYCVDLKNQPGADEEISGMWQEAAEQAEEHARIILSYYFASVAA